MTDATSSSTSSPDGEVRNFHKLYYDSENQTWRDTYWLGVPVLKCPLDLWVYQELVHRLRPDHIVEAGTHKGGSAFFLACLCELLRHGKVISIDISFRGDRPEHERIEYIEGSSIADETLATVREIVSGSETVLVILDSDHDREHVLAELRAYSTIVTVGSYLIVEDTNLNGHPVRSDWGPGPAEAVECFLGESATFRRDPSLEKHFLTFNPGGYLVRVA